MKRPLIAVALVALCASAAAPGLAATPEKGDVGPGWIATSNVKHVATIPVDTDIAGGRMVGKDFFVRTAKGITIYDTTNPELPTPKGFVAVPATPNQEREDIDTNGKVLVTGQSYDGTLYVVDVRNRTAPTLLAALPRAAGHTNTCVLDCTYVYGSEGTIVDLRVPTAPKLLAKRWTTAGTAAVRTPEGHDLTEVTPGRLLVASRPVAYLDASDPSDPRPITGGKWLASDTRYIHGVEWPRKGEDRFVLAGSETIDIACQNQVGTLTVFDTSGFREGQALDKPVRRDFDRVGHFELTKGNPLDREGRHQVAQHCGHWFDVHPTFADGGLLAMAWYTYGVRFLDVSTTGQITERGFWQPLPGQTSAVYWASPDVVYATDYTGRGFDVLKLDRTKPAEADSTVRTAFIPAGSAAEKAAAERLARSHHGTLGALAQQWVCRPDGSMAPAGTPTLASLTS